MRSWRRPLALLRIATLRLLVAIRVVLILLLLTHVGVAALVENDDLVGVAVLHGYLMQP